MAKPDMVSNRISIGVGITSLVTIFLVLLLTTFSVLTLVSARYDSRLSAKTIEATSAYYAADQQACLWLAEVQAIVDKQSQEQWQSLITATMPEASVQADNDLESPESLEAGCVFSIDSNRYLDVRLLVTQDGNIRIIDWLIKATGEE
ncbi:MAG: hypothetical protein LBU61_04175 [Coriobacteriales bacterium]|jgi:Tfp pilus assembly protein PilX|nr:hypothetical protein [Coriobacteriales bacterium]